MPNLLSVFICSLIILSTQNIYPQKGKFNKACKLNTEDSYRGFIEKYPDSDYIPQAMDKLSKLVLVSVKEENSLTAYQGFIEEYPNSNYIPEAKFFLAKLVFVSVKEENSLNAYKAFIEKYPNSDHIPEARNNLSNLVFVTTREENSISAYQDFITNYPNSDSLLIANAILEELEFAKAKEINSFKSYNEFINKYPNSAHIEEVIKLRDNMKLISYYVNEDNYREISRHLRNKYPESYKVFIDGLLYKSNSTPNIKPDEHTSTVARDQLRQIHNRPITSDNYDILNMLGCWIRLASDRASGGTFESAFSGTFFINLLFSWMSPVEINGEEVLRGLFYVTDEERKSNDPNLTAFKLATLDLFEDVYNDKTQDKVNGYIESISKNEVNKEVLTRIQSMRSR